MRNHPARFLLATCVAMFGLSQAVTSARGCHSSSGGSAGGNTLLLIASTKNVQLNYPFDVTYSPNTNYFGGVMDSQLPNADGSNTTAAGNPSFIDSGQPARATFYDMRLPAMWKFQVVTLSTPCSGIYAPVKSVPKDGNYSYQCPAYYSGSTFVGSDDPYSTSGDPDGVEVIDPNDIGELLDDGNAYMYAGDGLVSQNGDWILLYLSDGNLIEFDSSFTPVWMSFTSGSGGGGSHVHLQDGDLVIYNSGVSPVFSSSTGGHSGAYMVCQNDGNIVIYDSGNSPIWSTGIP